MLSIPARQEERRSSGSDAIEIPDSDHRQTRVKSHKGYGQSIARVGRFHGSRFSSSWRTCRLGDAWTLTYGDTAICSVACGPTTQQLSPPIHSTHLEHSSCPPCLQSAEWKMGNQSTVGSLVLH